MAETKPFKVLQAGFSGPVADIFRSIEARPNFPFEPEAIATASHPEIIGKRLGELALTFPPRMENVPIVSLEDAVHNSDAVVVFSCLKGEAADEYEDKLARGRTLATNASNNRMRSDVALVNAYINGQQLDELFGQEREGYIMANGNCVAGIDSVPLAPIHRHIGIVELDIKTMQGWSGAGKLRVPKEHRKGRDPSEEVDLYPDIGDDEKDKIENEPKRFLGNMSEPASIKITAEPKRGPWVRGHYSVIKAKLAQSTNEATIRSLWQDFRAPEALIGIKYGKYSPVRAPIKLPSGALVNGNLLNQRYVNRMSVSVRLINLGGPSKDELTFAVCGDNLALGAAGSSAMNMVLAKELGYIK